MVITQIEDNIKQLVSDFASSKCPPDIFIYELLLEIFGKILNIWGQSKNYRQLFGLGPRFSAVTRLPDSFSTSCLNLSLPRAIPLFEA